MDSIWDNLQALFLEPITYLNDPSKRIYFPYLATSFLVAVLLSVWDDVKSAEEASNAGGERVDKESSSAARKGLTTRILASIFPRSVYLHPSAIADYFYYYSNTILYAIISAPSIFSLAKFSSLTFQAWEYLCGTPWSVGAGPSVSLTSKILYSAAIILAADLGLFLAHKIQHEIPFLWNFHKVHHSAEVLTPITVYRMHPIDDMISFFFSGFLAGVADGTLRYFCQVNISPMLVGGVNVFLFLFYVGFYHLRHSHIWLSYGEFWSKVLISPAQHQIHHSVKRKHWNKNYGFIFAFWDYLAGSLYVPKAKEKIVFGIGDGSEREYTGALMLYWKPFRDALGSILKKRE